MFLGILIGLAGGLILLYMLRPHYKPYQLSSAVFFEQKLNERNTSTRITLTAVIFSRPFWVQFTVLATLITALLLSVVTIEGTRTSNTIGVLVALDTSASMDTRYGEGVRLDAAFSELEQLTNQLIRLRDVHHDVHFCVSMLTFDSGGARDVFVNVSPENLLTAADVVDVRLLGTNLNLVRMLLMLLDDQERSNFDNCMITHVVVITDRPAPDWVLDEVEGVNLIWRHIGAPADNVGITRITPIGTTLFGWGGQIEVEVSAYGSPPTQTTIIIEDESGVVVQQQSLSWVVANSQSVILRLDAAGLYTVTVSPGGDYPHDDHATIQAPDFETIYYDWRLPIEVPTYFDSLGWVQDSIDPDIRIASFGETIGGVPTLIVGDFYFAADGIIEIGYFNNDSGILNNLSLDVAEQLNIRALPFPANIPHKRVLTDREGNIFVAANTEAPFVYIPGPPSMNRDVLLDAFSQTLFFNAVRWLLGRDNTIELYHLTSASQPFPEGNITVLHSGEGNTALQIAHHGNLTDIEPMVAEVVYDDPVWMALTMMAGIILVLERLLALRGGIHWQ